MLGWKKNFLGIEAVNPSVGQACAKVAASVDHFMTYKVYGMCPDDRDMAQKLIASDYDPLPRRCFSRTPTNYRKPLSINTSFGLNLVMLTSYGTVTNVDYSCLVSKVTMDRRRFFACADCFNLSKRGWDIPTNESVCWIHHWWSLKVKAWRNPNQPRFQPTTGTFAAMMRERNVTIVSATLNEAPFNEVIALRGLFPLYVLIGSRIPFFDNTLDIVCSTLILDGWDRNTIFSAFWLEQNSSTAGTSLGGSFFL